MPKAANARAKKPSSSKSYSMPEKISVGTILTDLSKVQWRVGSSIGKGGFGEIYAACRVGESENYNYIVKCEPHENGPLFVEMHFYMRNARLEDIKQFMQSHRLKALGMSYMLGNGSIVLKNIKHRFIVLPRFGSDIKALIAANGNKLPEGTAYRIALQMLDVYEFIHSCGYVHADLKSANIVLGREKGGSAQTYLIDFGLAAHFNTKDFTPDPKKMHNGTIEYTSRDAHQGVSTMRGDMEILGYNLIEWIGYQLPWVKDKLLANPVKVQKAKEDFFSKLDVNLKNVLSNNNHVGITEFMNNVHKLKHNDVPDYEKFRRLFINALKKLNVKMIGDLDFKNITEIKKVKTTKKVKDNVDNNDSENEIEEEMNETPPTIKRTKNPKEKVITSQRLKVNSPRTNRRSPSKSPVKTKSQIREKKTNTKSEDTPPNRNRVTPLKRNRVKTQSNQTESKHSPKDSNNSSIIKTVKFNSATSSKKTYELNFELDISLDANMIINLKRKRKDTDNVSKSPSKRSIQGSNITVDGVLKSSKSKNVKG